MSAATASSQMAIPAGAETDPELLGSIQGFR